MISNFKIGDFVSDNTDSEVIGQVVATPDTDYSIGENYVKVLWLDTDSATTIELAEELLKLEYEDIPVETE